jgi:hypothetical protein
MARWRHSFYKLVPSWLSTGDGEKVLHTLGRVTDGFIERARQSLTARFPTYSGPTGLAMLGDERGIIKGRDEGNAGYARRLRGWRGLRGHKVRGNPYAMLYQIWNYFGGMTVREVDAAGNVFTTARDGTESVTHGGVWNWDSDPPGIPGGGEIGDLAPPDHDDNDGADVPDLLINPGVTSNLVLHCDGTPGRMIFLHIGTRDGNTVEPEAIKNRGWNLASSSVTVAGTGHPYRQMVFWRITGRYEEFTSINVACTHTSGSGVGDRFIGRAVNVPGSYVEQSAIVEAVTVRGNGTTAYTPQVAQDTPHLRAVGTSVFINSAATMNVPYPNGPEPLQAGDVFYMQVVARAGAANPTTPTGWTLVSGPDLTGDAVNGRAYLYKRTAVATGTEGGTTQALAAFSAASVQARIYAFAGLASHEELTIVSGQLSSDGAALVPAGDYRLCAALVAGVASGGVNTTVTTITGTDSVGRLLVGGTWSKACDDAANQNTNGALVQSLQVAPEALGGSIEFGSLTVSQGWHVVHYLCLAGTHVNIPCGYRSLGLLFAQGRLTTYSAASGGWTELDAERTAGATGIGIDEQFMVVPEQGQGPGVITLGATSALNLTVVRVIPKLPAPWYRFWLTLVPAADQGIRAHPEIGDPLLWGGNTLGNCGAYTIGQTGVTPGDAAVVTNLFRGDHPWKMAGTKPEWLVLVLGEDEAHAPDGTWRNFTPGRYPGWRYWKL